MIAGRVKAVVFLIIVMLALSSPVVYAVHNDAACQQEKSVKGKMEAGRQELYKDLNLTDEQKKLLEANKAKHREEMKALAGQMKEKKAEVRQELQKDQLDMAKITQLNNELKALQAQMLDHRLESTLEVRKILTPEQFKKFISKIEDWPKHFKKR